MILDLFAGPGGWSAACADLELDETGIEIDPQTCQTRARAGYRTVRADVARFEPRGPIRGLIASPPCQTFSRAGERDGIRDLDALRASVWPGTPPPATADPRTALVLEPLRYVDALHPDWIVLEQVPVILDLWRDYAARWRGLGYSTWTGILNAADHGVPQTRRRAILLASRTKPAHPPQPTHTDRQTQTLFGELAPWRTMRDALGWDGDVGFARRDDLGGDGHRARDRRDTHLPSFALTEKARSWTLNPGLTDTQPNRRTYDLDEPAPTVAFGHDPANWQWTDQEATVRISIADALVLQSFPPDFPVAGSRTSQFAQIGNAVPPLFARALIGAVA